LKTTHHKGCRKTFCKTAKRRAGHTATTYIIRATLLFSANPEERRSVFLMKGDYLSSCGGWNAIIFHPAATGAARANTRNDSREAK
jgi:hypothetical protein